MTEEGGSAASWPAPTEDVGVERLPSAAADCGVYLPGWRHRGRAVVVAQLAALAQRPTVSVADLARLVAYYHSVPRKSAAKHGLVLLVVGRPDRYPKAFSLVEQLVTCHDRVTHPFSCFTAQYLYPSLDGATVALRFFHSLSSRRYLRHFSLIKY